MGRDPAGLCADGTTPPGPTSGVPSAGVTGVGRRTGAEGATGANAAAGTGDTGGTAGEDGEDDPPVPNDSPNDRVGRAWIVGAAGGVTSAATLGGAYGGVGAHAGPAAGGSGACTRVAAGVGRSRFARTSTSGARDVELGNSSAHRTLAPTGIRPPQIEHRARRLAPVTLAGSTRKTEWHSGHETFMTRQSR